MTPNLHADFVLFSHLASPRLMVHLLNQLLSSALLAKLKTLLPIVDLHVQLEHLQDFTRHILGPNFQKQNFSFWCLEEEQHTSLKNHTLLMWLQETNAHLHNFHTLGKAMHGNTHCQKEQILGPLFQFAALTVPAFHGPRLYACVKHQKRLYVCQGLANQKTKCVHTCVTKCTNTCVTKCAY